MAKFNDSLAAIVGTNAAIVAELLWSIVNKDQQGVIKKYGRKWGRCSMKMMTVRYPFLSIHQVEYALKVLRMSGIISKGNFNSSRFDHANWYSFTEYGLELVK